MVSPVLAFLFLAAVFLHHRLDLISLGDQHAIGLGVRLNVERLLLLGIAVLLASVSVSVVGALGFVGLMSPHLASSLVGSSHRALMPTAIIIGMLLTVVADSVGRSIAPPIEISAGILTALLGAPFFIFIFILLITSKKSYT